jgi:asparagine synthase (glutamine-hydrolysing)
MYTTQLEPRKILNIDLNQKSLILNKFEYYEIKTNTLQYEPEINSNYFEQTLYKIRESLIQSVKDRLYSERPLGCLLSGGLDSSLIAGIASNILKEKGEKLNTFSIGMSETSPDVLYAKIVADYIGSNHTTVIIPPNEWIDALPKIIYQIETYDTTTIRASTGQYLLGKWISENTNIKVLLNGDGSDEITSGYLYFYNAPTSIDSSLENKRLLENIHFYDVLRVDRGISAHGLEARVPFLCHHFVDTYLSIDHNLRNPIKNERIEKYLLRKSFESLNLIPSEVLWRKKEAFSDGVSNQEKSWYQLIEESIPNDFSYEPIYVGHIRPVTKESQLFRKYFDFYYPNKSNILETNEYWLPKWSGNILNPSARILNVYQE